MKILIALIFLMGGACKRAPQTNAEPLPEEQMMNIKYGTQPGQSMDLYLPGGRGTHTKTIVLVHGGGWSGGSRRDLNYLLPMLKQRFPEHAVANIDYRLATSNSPAFPKQVRDLELAIRHLRESDYGISEEFAFIGASAGAHIALLYSYRFDHARAIKAIAVIVGPVDFTDPSYTSNPYFHFGLTPVIGASAVHPDLIKEVSPAAHVSEKSPPTIMFYGEQDPLIPATQGPRLKEKLDDFGIASQLHLYPGAGHGNWNSKIMEHVGEKLHSFFDLHF